MTANERLENAGYEFMSGANGRPGLWTKRVRGGPVIVIRVDGYGWAATAYPRESYPDGGVVIAEAPYADQLLAGIARMTAPVNPVQPNGMGC